MTRLTVTREVINKFLPHINGRVLDLGAGSAKYREIILKKASEYRSCDAVKNEDIDDVCDVLNLPYSAESFNTVISTQVIEHVNNPYRMAEQIYKVLKPGGKIIVTAPFLILKHSDPGDYFRFTAGGLLEVFKQSGFTIIESGCYGGFFMVLSEMIHFSFFNPYSHRSSRLMGFIEKIAKILDKIFTAKTIYANSFVVAKKP